MKTHAIHTYTDQDILVVLGSHPAHPTDNFFNDNADHNKLYMTGKVIYRRYYDVMILKTLPLEQEVESDT